MGYVYEDQKSTLFTDEGQRMFLRARDNVEKMLDMSGAVMMGAAITGIGDGDSWEMLACVDRLVELGEIREIEQGDVCGQYRIFVRAKR